MLGRQDRIYIAPLEIFEVRSTPEKLKYIKSSNLKKYLIKPVLTRGAWAATFVLSALATIPLTGKCLLNLIDGCFHRPSLKAARKNALALLGMPIIFFLSGLSVLMPSVVGGRLGRAVAVPITLIYSWNKNLGKQQPSQAIYPKVNGIDGVLIDSVDVLSEPFVQRYRIVFNASVEIYQVSFNKFLRENAKLKCNTRAFNYPGITRDDAPGSILDFVNAGIAQVYDLAKRKDWVNADLEKNLHLFGYCFGGGVALQVAAYFKEKHNVNILTFVDRSFTSYLAAMAGVIHRYSGLPLAFSKLLAATFLYGSGDLDLDSIVAVKKLNPKKIHYINLGHKISPSVPDSLINKFRFFFGIGPAPDCADSILFDGVALADGLSAAKIQCGLGTRDIFKELKIAAEDHRVYELVKDEGHFVSLSELSLTRERMPEEKLSAQDYYKRVIDLMQKEEETELLHEKIYSLNL